MLNLKTKLENCIQLLEQIRGVINTNALPVHDQYGVPVNRFVRNLSELLQELASYNNYYFLRLQTIITNLKNNNGTLNPYKLGEVTCLLNIIKNELDNNFKYAQNNNAVQQKTLNIFIGHGHNLLWARIALYISDVLKIKPRYFEDENRCGEIIPCEIEKFVNDINIRLGIFILLKEIKSEDGYLPRQNVIDEAARFSTKLGRERVLLIVEEGVKIPSNLSGIVYLEYKNDIEGILPKIKDFIEKFN